MKKTTTTTGTPAMIGLDLGDKSHRFCMLDAEGKIVGEGRIFNTALALAQMFESRPPCSVAMETGTHSPWISRTLEGWGHEALVGNARKLRAIYQSAFKSDREDAEMVARIARADRALFHPIRHRGPKAQADLAVLKSREVLVGARTKMINHCRGLVKSGGGRLPSCSAEAFAKKVKVGIPSELAPALGPVLVMIEELNAKIKGMDYEIGGLCKEYPETERLREVKGVGPVTSLAFVLTLEEPGLFAKSRTVPAYLGLVPRRDQSGDTDKELRITGDGDRYLRCLLVSCAQYVLGPFGGDSDLRRWGLKICERGGKSAKRRAVVAVARKLAVLLHRLWSGEEPYDPFYDSSRKKKREEEVGEKQEKKEEQVGEKKEKREEPAAKKRAKAKPVRKEGVRKQPAQRKGA